MPAKPGLVREPAFKGPGIEVELWTMSERELGSVLDVQAELAWLCLRKYGNQKTEPAAFSKATTSALLRTELRVN